MAAGCRETWKPLPFAHCERGGGPTRKMQEHLWPFGKLGPSRFKRSNHLFPRGVALKLQQGKRGNLIGKYIYEIIILKCRKSEKPRWTYSLVAPVAHRGSRSNSRHSLSFPWLLWVIEALMKGTRNEYSYPGRTNGKMATYYLAY
jgi:hypothetical protein